jgi:ribosomal protein S25
LGGAKKPRLSQLEKKITKSKEEESEKQPQKREKLVSDVIPPSIEELIEFARTQKYLTPFVVSEKFGIRLSIAKQVLNRLAEMRLVKLVSGNSKLRIFTPIEVVTETAKSSEEQKEKPTAPKKKTKQSKTT